MSSLLDFLSVFGAFYRFIWLNICFFLQYGLFFLLVVEVGVWFQGWKCSELAENFLLIDGENSWLFMIEKYGVLSFGFISIWRKNFDDLLMSSKLTKTKPFEWKVYVWHQRCYIILFIYSEYSWLLIPLYRGFPASQPLGPLQPPLFGLQ